MTRVLVLGGSGIVIPDEAVEAIEAVAESGNSGTWLPKMLGRDGAVGIRDVERRALRLRGGGRVEVPAAMTIEEVEVLTLPALLQPIGQSCGVVGITTLSEGLGLVCDPRLLPLADRGGAP